MNSKVASFPAVVAAKRAAVSQLSYYRSMMGTDQTKQSAVHPTSTQVKTKIGMGGAAGKSRKK